MLGKLGSPKRAGTERQLVREEETKKRA
jgi:hypothetical protein